MADEDDFGIPEDIGFSDEELKELVDGLVVDSEDLDIEEEAPVGVIQDTLPDFEQEDLLVEPGDTWTLGKHKIVCGDCTEVQDLVKILDGVSPVVLWADPPADGIDDTEVGTTGVKIAAEYLQKGASVFLKYRSTALDELSEMWVQPLRLCSELVWISDAPMVDEKYFRRNHESIWYGWKFGGLRKWTSGGTVPTVYNFPRPATAEEFSGILPVELIGFILRNVIEEGDIVYNPFSGFGSALIACDQLGARCFCIEKSPKKCDFIIRRWQQFTGDKAYKEE